MIGIKVVTPRLPVSLDASDLLLEDDAQFEACRLTDRDFSDISAAAVGMDEVLCEKVGFSGARLARLSVRDARMNRCDFTTAHCPESSWRQVTFDGGRMTGWDVSRSMIKDVHFSNCKIDMVNFRFAKLQRVRFEDCVLVGADFAAAHLTEVSFERCILERADFSQSHLKQVDFRTSDMRGLGGWQYLKGAVIDNAQLLGAASYLAQEIGIIVED